MPALLAIMNSWSFAARSSTLFLREFRACSLELFLPLHSRFFF